MGEPRVNHCQYCGASLRASQAPEPDASGVYHKDGPLAQIEQMAEWVSKLPSEHVEIRNKIAANLRAALAGHEKGLTPEEATQIRQHLLATGVYGAEWDAIWAKLRRLAARDEGAG